MGLPPRQLLLPLKPQPPPLRRRAGTLVNNYNSSQSKYYVEAIQLTRILPLVCSFFTLRGEKRTYKNVKYHAAAG
jgi:hypothetical protein